MRTSRAVGAVVAAALVLGACADDGDGEGETATESSAPTSAVSGSTSTAGGAGSTLRAQLTGTAEVPGPGDPDGRGTATITLDSAARKVCFELAVSQIDTATAAHIHQGPAGTAGDVKVTLEPPASGSSRGCADAEAAVIGQLATVPDGFYVNVHNAAFPQGAVRGQLSR